MATNQVRVKEAGAGGFAMGGSSAADFGARVGGSSAAGFGEGGFLANANEVSLLVVARYLLSKWYWLLLAGAVVGLVVFGAVKLLVTPTYQSSVSFYVYNSPDSITSTKTVNNQDLQAAESLATTYASILESNTVFDAVLDDLGAESRGLTRSDLSSMTRAFVISDTQLLEVEVTSSDPGFACRVAQSFERVAPGEMQKITKVGGVEVVDQPEVSGESISPRVSFDAAVGVVVGMVIAAIVLTARMLADKTIYVPEDIEGTVTVLGAIPDIEGAAAKKSWTVVFNEKVDHGAEA